MPRFTLALSCVTNASFIELKTGRRSEDWGLALSNPSLAPTTRTPVASASSPSCSDSIVLRLMRDRSSIRNHATPDSSRRSTRTLAIV